MNRPTSTIFFERKEPLATYVICISLNDDDRIRVLAPDNIVRLIRDVIYKNWSLGCGQERQVLSAYEFKLNGKPWSFTGRKEEYCGVPTLLSQILERLAQFGYIYAASIKTNKDLNSLSAIYLKFDERERSLAELYPPKVFSVSLKDANKLLLNCVDNSIIDGAYSALSQIWKYGIQQNMRTNTSVEFCFNGELWSAIREKSANARQLLNGLFYALRVQGWQLYATCDLSKQVATTSTFFFRSQPPPAAKVPNNMCISLNNVNKIRVIQGNQYIVNEIRSMIKSRWHRDIKSEGLMSNNNTYEFLLNGKPFFCDCTDEIFKCALFIGILDKMKVLGFDLISSADVNCKFYNRTKYQKEQSIDLHSFFFE